MQEQIKLSGRELQVIRLLLQGEKQTAIALELHIATRTVETYVQRAKGKLGAATTVQLVFRVVETGCCPMPTRRKIAT